MVWNRYLIYVDFWKVSTHNPFYPMPQTFQKCIALTTGKYAQTTQNTN